MTYALKPGRPVDREVRRNLDAQLRLAIAELRAVRGPQDAGRVCAARRHVKKARALAMLVAPVTPRTGRPTVKRLRRLSRMLSPIADGAALVDTFAAVRPALAGVVPARDLTAMGTNLREREAWLDHTARIERVSREAVARLRKERVRLRSLRLGASDWDAVAPGLDACVRSSRRAMRRAATGREESYHAWRRRAKAHRVALRLLELRCGRRLAAERRRLDRLDGLLGEFHNGALLQQVLVAERIGSRPATAACLRVLRQRDADLRNDALTLGREVYAERPSQTVARIGRYWSTSRTGRAAAAGRRS